MPTAFLSQTSGYVPNHEATGKMIVDYSRNPKSFASNRYAQIVPVTQTTGFYLKITPDNAARSLTATADEFAWADGQDAPTGADNHKEFEFLSYFTKRRAFPWTLGDKAVSEASWDVVAMYSAMVAQQAMTIRARRLQAILSASGNYGGTATATAASGGKWDVATTANNYIQKSLNAGKIAIHRATLGAVKTEDLHLVISPALALLMAQSQEIVDHLKQSPFALAQIKGDAPSQNGKWGLPDQLYGINIEVEDTVYVGTQKGGTTTYSDVMASTIAALIARPGGVEGHYGGPSLSFLTMFTLEEMSVETKKDADNRLTRGRVVDDYDCVATAPAAGYLFTAVSG